MTPYIITYDLYKGTRTNYQSLYNVLIGAGAVRATESMWLLASSLDVIRIGDVLRGHLHSKDVLTVNVLARDCGFSTENLSFQALLWVNQHLKTATHVV